MNELKSLRRELELGVDRERYQAPGPRDERIYNHLAARSRVIIPAALAIAIVIAAAVWFVRSSRTPARTAKPIKSLAVSPMLNLSGDHSQEYFADGMTETLITGLAKVTALRVTSRTSVMQFKGSQKPLKRDRT